MTFVKRLDNIEISIHALRVEGDLSVTVVVLFRLISIHALRVEGDNKQLSRIS